jgi:flagellar secretion chaperone FliS
VYKKLIKNAAAYSQVGLESGVLSANPHKLICILMEGALSSIAAARVEMIAGEIQAKSNSIAKAMNILSGGLKGALDLRKGGEIAIHLYSLYSYMTGRLFLANLKNQPEMLDEVTSLLGQIHDAWSQIGPAKAGYGQLQDKNPISIAA